MLKGSLTVSALILLGITFTTNAAESTTPPEIAQRSAINASLAAMQSNGVMARVQQQATQRRQADTAQSRTAARAVDTNLPIPVKHVLVCETEAHCQAASNWGNNNNFQATAPLSSRGHGGELQYHLYLRQHIQPTTDIILSETARVHDGIQSLAGVNYATWMLDLDPLGGNDQEAD